MSLATLTQPQPGLAQAAQAMADVAETLRTRSARLLRTPRGRTQWREAGRIYPTLQSE